MNKEIRNTVDSTVSKILAVNGLKEKKGLKIAKINETSNEWLDLELKLTLIDDSLVNEGLEYFRTELQSLSLLKNSQSTHDKKEQFKARFLKLGLEASKDGLVFVANGTIYSYDPIKQKWCKVSLNFGSDLTTKDRANLEVLNDEQMQTLMYMTKDTRDKKALKKAK
ncbi:MAG: hypothetical protein Unbinned2990contig1002_46 [Prokaryotic dsDNA virus sp.]|nr:MAG: hypothetical protein Unbinned2990contig1002_46 [Prokaryotic dsDNA virus sp.]|tara:strand:+ start:6249 stop:6749 length:501 start_codon:yes stop_codon:yes gene_type:complete